MSDPTRSLMHEPVQKCLGSILLVGGWLEGVGEDKVGGDGYERSALLAVSDCFQLNAFDWITTDGQRFVDFRPV